MLYPPSPRLYSQKSYRFQKLLKVRNFLPSLSLNINEIKVYLIDIKNACTSNQAGGNFEHIMYQGHATVFEDPTSSRTLISGSNLKLGQILAFWDHFEKKCPF